MCIHDCSYTKKVFMSISQLKCWMPLCSPALDIWRGKQSVTLCLLSTAALTDTGERPSLFARHSLPLYPPTHLLPSDCACAPLSDTHEPKLTWVFIIWRHLTGTIIFSSAWEYQGMLTESFSRAPTYMDVHAHTTECSPHLTPDSR